MGLDLSGNGSSETMCDEGAGNLWSSTMASELWGQGGTLYPQVQDLYPLYLPSQRCGLCQNFKQTTLTTRFYKVRTNFYPQLRKRSDAPVSIYTADKKLRLLHKTPTENLPAGSQNLSAPSGCICRPRGQSTRRSFWVFVHPQFVVLATRNCALHH